MKELTKEFLQKVEEDYKNKDVYTIARHALAKAKIGDLIYVSEQTEFTRNHFSIDLKTLPVTDQKASGRCWIFAGLNVLREKIAKKYNLENFELSQNYVAFYDKLEKCNYLMESVISLIDQPKENRTLDLILEKGIEDGGQWDLLVNVIQKYGVVPKDVFPETFQSSNTRAIDGLLNKFMRKFAFEIRDLKGDMDAVRQKKDAVMEDVYKILCSAFGIPPKTFSFEYVDKDKNYHIVKNLTPQEFMKDYVEVDLSEYVSIINSPTKDKPFYQTYTVKYLGNVIEGNKVLYLNEEMPRMKDLIIAQLKDGEPVWFGSDCSKSGDSKAGFWDDKSFDMDLLFQIDTSMSKEAMLDTRQSAMNHAMVITGVNLEDGKPTKWKIENSWGSDNANKGYHVATDSWVDKYVFQAVINKKYLSEFEKNDLQKTPIELEPWDPMGTLA